jgi:hypothetical protein
MANRCTEMTLVHYNKVFPPMGQKDRFGIGVKWLWPYSLKRINEKQGHDD